MKELAINDLVINPITLFKDDWCLVTAGNQKDGYNSMTVSWGSLGAIWSNDKQATYPIITVYIRPQRYTKQFFDKEEYFTVSTFDKKHYHALEYMGTHSGKDEDKITNAGLKPLFIDDTTALEDANMIFVCKKLYNAPLLEDSFIDNRIVDNNYPKKDFHDMYMGEITKILIK